MLKTVKENDLFCDTLLIFNGSNQTMAIVSKCFQSLFYIFVS